MKDFGEPKIKLVAMPSDTNPAGNIFGGWILSQIDLAGYAAAMELVSERVVTVSVKEVIFKEPVLIGDLVSFYAKNTAVGKSSITTKVEVVAHRLDANGNSFCIPVTSAEVVYVSVDKECKNKLPISEEKKRLHGF